MSQITYDVLAADKQRREDRFQAAAAAFVDGDDESARELADAARDIDKKPDEVRSAVAHARRLSRAARNRAVIGDDEAIHDLARKVGKLPNLIALAYERRRLNDQERQQVETLTYSTVKSWLDSAIAAITSGPTDGRRKDELVEELRALRGSDLRTETRRFSLCLYALNDGADPKIVEPILRSAAKALSRFDADGLLAEIRARDPRKGHLLNR